MEEAPFFASFADGPKAGHAVWIKCADGVRIRVGIWPEGEKGTVLLFPGRTEYVEKYGRAAADLRARGYATVTVDWRGQGLADRALKDRNSGYVEHFSDFQKDLAAVLDVVREVALPTPLYLISHSMGGAIAFRALHEGLRVKAAVFSAPMWGILLSPAVRPFAWALSHLSSQLGFSHVYAPGTGPVTYTASAPFMGNVLTSDAEMYRYMVAQVEGVPELALGGPSLHWVHEALQECRVIRALPSPKMPVLTFLGTAEKVVDSEPVHERMARWPGGKLELVPGAEHEVMMETPAIRARFFDASAALFDANR
ncbi:lysophospholipase L2 [mine drainage metagenome]|uniref:Lysophospholipase L2 n=1 Tax=mine drainage metagenome TaxID=410659 RepID=A0A1J5QJ99_9ZZZZ